MNEMVKANVNLPVTQEATAILNAAQEDAGFEKLLKFKKGVYVCDGQDVPQGTQYIAHCVGWTKCWIKFRDGQVVERRTYPVAQGKLPPEREELDDKDQSTWEPGLDGKPADPWVYQHLLPLEDKAGDLVVFVTASIGGKRAVADLCKLYARRAARTGVAAQPLVKITVAVMPSQRFGNVPRPNFEVIGWDEHREAVRDFAPPDTLKEEMNDDIPF